MFDPRDLDYLSRVTWYRRRTVAQAKTRCEVADQGDEEDRAKNPVDGFNADDGKPYQEGSNDRPRHFNSAGRMTKDIPALTACLKLACRCTQVP